MTKDKERYESIYNWCKLGLIIMATVALGIFAVNQALGYYYKTEFLGNPCSLCVKLNPDWEQCYRQVTHTSVVPNYSLVIPNR